MKITHRAPTDADLSQRIQNDKVTAQVRPERNQETQSSGDSTKVNISKEGRELQRIAELARTGDEIRAQKVQQLKEQIAGGDYKVDAKDVSKSIVRSEVSRLLQEK
ncbi:MAG TPA: flagellar biosynthesis anti-sigma factor FlgM [Candidatus Binatia bacterium]|jgi:flagellar biosynthesis anti-sigma factor FlgM